jgi:uncharacterized membrane protein
MQSSTGLSSRAAAALAYSGWWLTGAIFWFIERRDAQVRFHAAQATVTFGTIAAFIMLCAALAIASLSFLPALFSVLAWLAAAAWAGGVILWAVSMWRALSGDEWRIPIAADWAERLSIRASAAASS